MEKIFQDFNVMHWMPIPGVLIWSWHIPPTDQAIIPLHKSKYYILLLSSEYMNKTKLTLVRIKQQDRAQLKAFFFFQLELHEWKPYPLPTMFAGWTN